MKQQNILESYYAQCDLEYVNFVDDSIVLLTGKAIFVVWLKNEYESWPSDMSISMN